MSQNNFSVMMPYRFTQSREPLQIAVTKWWQDNFGITPVQCDTSHEIFNLAAIRNKCVDESDNEIVIITDADTIGQKQAITQAVDMVGATGNTCLPFTSYNVLSKQGTVNFLSGKPIELQQNTSFSTAVSGLIVTTKATWDKHNGQDERFIGWGAEDVCWSIAYETLIGSLSRVKATVWTLHHQSASKNVDIANKTQLRNEYINAKGNAELMAKLVQGNR